MSCMLMSHLERAKLSYMCLVVPRSALSFGNAQFKALLVR